MSCFITSQKNNYDQAARRFIVYIPDFIFEAGYWGIPAEN